MSCDLGSLAVEASDRCEGAIEGARVGAALQVDMRSEVRLPVSCDCWSLGGACCDMVQVCMCVQKQWCEEWWETGGGGESMCEESRQKKGGARSMLLVQVLYAGGEGACRRALTDPRAQPRACLKRTVDNTEE